MEAAAAVFGEGFIFERQGNISPALKLKSFRKGGFTRNLAFFVSAYSCMLKQSIEVDSSYQASKCGLTRKRKPFAVVSHAHGDHVANHDCYLATPETIALIRA